MATHSSILAWRIPWMEELGGLQSTGRKEWDTTERLHFQTCIKVWMCVLVLHFKYIIFVLKKLTVLKDGDRNVQVLW